jgi:nucleotide-binding universal stress UspA family protein
MNKVVVGVDGSHRSMRALQWATRYAVATGSTMTVIACCEPLNPNVWVPNFAGGRDSLAPTKQRLMRLVRDLQKRHPELTVDCDVVEGNPGKVLTERSSGADLLVVGSRGLGAVSGLLLGSVGAYCVSHAQCPVVVWRERATAKRSASPTPAQPPGDGSERPAASRP